MSKSFVKYLVSLLLFGTNGIVAAHIALTSQEIVWFRTLLGSILLVGLFVITRQKLTCLKDRRQFVFLVLSGVAMAGGWLFVYEAYQRVGVSLGTLLYYCGPIIVMALSPLVMREKLRPSKLVAFVVVVVGLVLVNGLALQEGTDVAGLLCGVGAAITYAIMVLCNKKATDVGGLENSMMQLVVALVVVSIYVGLTEGLDIQVPEDAWPAILMLGLVNTGCGCYLYFSSIGKLPAQTVAVVGYAEPLSAVIFSVILLGEQMLPLQMLGAACIIGGAAFCELSGMRHAKNAAGANADAGVSAGAGAGAGGSPVTDAAQPCPRDGYSE